MDGTVVIGIASGVAVAAGLMIYQSLQRKKDAVLGQKIEGELRKREQTLPDLAQALGMPGIMGRGKVAMALNAMVNQGRVVVIPAPDGTPPLERVKHITYRLKG